MKPVSAGEGPPSADGFGATGMKLTYDDFLLFPDDGKRHELIDGEHYVTPSPNTKHQRVSGNLHFFIRSWLEDHPLGQVFYAPFDVVFSRFDVVEPDLLYLSNERVAEVVTAQHVTGAPDIIIEIGSPGTRRRDETIKRRFTNGRAFRSIGWSTPNWIWCECTCAPGTRSRVRQSSPEKRGTCCRRHTCRDSSSRSPVSSRTN